ncbi:MAG: hypothetical protein WD039_07095, partial [Xanthobacteraceae bacterium]
AAAPRPRLIAYQGCIITPKMADLLLAHIERPQPIPRGAGSTRKALMARCWIAPDDDGRETVITASGRAAALKVMCKRAEAGASA